jgi:hypothetical protein
MTVYASASNDGGRTFAPPVVVSRAGPCSDDTDVRSSTGGDYFGVIATGDRRFRLLWSEMREGIAHLVTTAIHVSQ